MLLLNFIGWSLEAQEVPGVVQYNSVDYGGDHQNWQITQDCKGDIYVANSDGILSYNGLKWERISLPENKKVRAVYTGADCKVYAGGYETFGYLDFNEGSKPVYVDITDSLLKESSQEIWNIFGNEDYIIFQSFSNIYLYDFHMIHSIIPPTNIMLGNNVSGSLYIPGITQGIYRMEGVNMGLINASESFPENSKIAALCQPVSGEGIIAATQQHGLFMITDEEVKPIESVVNDLLKIEQINRMIKLDSNSYVIGTILNGIYLVNAEFEVIYNINKTNGLTNNTVLSLQKDRYGDVWVGLDKGINLIKVSDPISYYYDIEGQLGTFFCYHYYNKELFIGTNQGVFKKENDGSFKLIKGLQGQSWAFLETEDGLFCAHNNGLFQLGGDELIAVDVATGTWWMEQITMDTILISTYTGLSRLTKSHTGWKSDRLEGGEFQIEKFVMHGKDCLIGYNPQNQLYVLKLDEDYSEILDYQSFSSLNDMSISSTLSLFNFEDHTVIAIEEKMFIYDDGALRELDQGETDKEIESMLLNVPDYHAFQLTKIIGDRMPRISGVKQEDPNYLISYDNGYASVPVNYHYRDYRKDSIYIDKVLVNGLEHELIDPEQDEFSYSQNDFIIQFGNKHFNEYLPGKYEYKLEGWSDLWYALPKDGRLEFINLTDEEYRLLLRRNAYENITHLWDFTIQPVWYKSWKGFILYIAFISILIWLINQRYEHNLKEERNKLEEEKRIELERERMNSKNEKLERELVHKSKMLANGALTLAQKNKMLSELKLIIKKIDKQETHIGKVKQKLLHLIDVNINSDGEWEIFEKNFEEVHESFLNNLKGTYPEITAGELRLAAYIRMNLSSKEIAPLLNISVRSVENKRYRLRKKMDLSPEETLSDHLMRL